MYELLLSKVRHPTKHIKGHIRDRLYRSNDPTNSVKAPKEDKFLRTRLHSHQVHLTVLTIIQQICSIKKHMKYAEINTNESMAQ